MSLSTVTEQLVIENAKLQRELLDLKSKAQAFLIHTQAVANAIQVMRDGSAEEYDGQNWDIIKAARHSLRGDTGAGKELKEAVK